MRGLLQARRQDRDSEPGEEGIPGRGGGAVRKRGRDNVRNELGEGLARRPTPLSHQAITRLPITIGVRGERPGDEHGRRLDRQPALRGQVAAEPGMAMFQVLAHIVSNVTRGLELTRNPGRVIGFHLLSITPGTDIASRACTSTLSVYTLHKAHRAQRLGQCAGLRQVRLVRVGLGRRPPRRRVRGAWLRSGPTGCGRGGHPVKPGYELCVGLGRRLW
jgi:hypothetical protein